TEVTAHGDMTVAISTDATQARPGASVSFRATATYTGDAPISGATLVALLPWRGGVGDAVCTTSSATNCVLDVRSGNVRATVDAAPGGSVEVTGHVLALPLSTDTATLYAKAYGPVGLAEPETKNNFAETTVVESLFANGFDGD